MLPLEKRWDISPSASIEAIQALGDYHPVLGQLLLNRRISTPSEAEKYLHREGSLYDPFLLKDMEIAVRRIFKAVDRGEPIAIYGDYDVDGITATTILVQLLEKLGGNVSGYIPDRFEEGYGLNIQALERLFGCGIRLIITVDCGVRSMVELSFANHLGGPLVRRKTDHRTAGKKHHPFARKFHQDPDFYQKMKSKLRKHLDIIISDHHEPGNKRLPALAIINPKQPGDSYPEKNLAGVGIAYKIAEAVLNRRPTEALHPEQWLDLVAIGTVADIVPLNDENRSLVRSGLKRIHCTHNQGLKSLAGAARIQVEKINTRDIGYRIGPRLNAAGRLQSAMKAFRLLYSPDVSATGPLALELDNQNQERQRRTREMQEKVTGMDHEITQANLLFAVHPDFDMTQSGLIGLVASRLTEEYYRPAIVCCTNQEVTRASCRSIPEFHITRALDQCEDLLVKYGGHAMAAGFTVKNENLPELRRRLLAIANEELIGKDLQPVLRADMEIKLNEIPQIFKFLDDFEPIGQGNPVPTFVTRGVTVKFSSAVGNDKKHLRLVISNGRESYSAIAFSQAHWLGRIPPKVDILYTCEKDEYRLPATIQLNVLDIKTANPQTGI